MFAEYLLVIVVGTIAVSLTSRRRPRVAGVLYAAVLAISTIPTFVDARRTAAYVQYSGQTNAAAADAFLTLSLIVSAGAIVLALVLARFALSATIGVPIMLWATYRYVCRRQLQRDLSSTSLDNVPNIWLFAVAVLSTLLFTICIWRMLQSRRAE